MASNAQAPAIINAIHYALGIWITELPPDGSSVEIAEADLYKRSR